jgi:hypothetical protein
MARVPQIPAAARRAILKVVKEGLPRKLAAQAAGISERSLYYFLAAARRGESPVAVQFLQQLKKARADGIRERVKRITQAAKKHWQADAWALERLEPAHFSLRASDIRVLQKQLGELLARLAQIEAVNAAANPPAASPPALESSHGESQPAAELGGPAAS